MCVSLLKVTTAYKLYFLHIIYITHTFIGYTCIMHNAMTKKYENYTECYIFQCTHGRENGLGHVFVVDIFDS